MSNYPRGGGGGMGPDMMRNGGRNIGLGHMPSYPMGGGGRIGDLGGGRGGVEFSGGGRIAEYGAPYGYDAGRGRYPAVIGRVDRDRDRDRERERER